MQEFQQHKLGRLVQHCYENVPFYTQAFNELGLRPGDIRTIEDLQKLPILSRDLLRTRQQDLLSTTADRKSLQTNFSSGSTGVRAEFVQDEEFRMWMRAHQLRTYEWCSGWQLGEPFVLLWGSEIYWKLKSVSKSFENLLSNRREFSTFNLSPTTIERFLQQLIRFQPALVSTYANAMHLIARAAEENNLKIDGLRAVQGTSEPMPPELRKNIERAFGCETFDKYGMRETNIVSHEAPTHDGMLIQSENVIVEIIGENGEVCPVGTPGRVVVTTLNNFAMPLVRYETSDIASLLYGSSKCGLPFPRMSSVVGRQQDLILTPNGDHVDAYLFSYLLMSMSEIHWFQVEQRELESLILRVYCPLGLPVTRVDEIRERIKRHTRYPFSIDVETLSQMPESSTGKFRLCISNLKDGHGV
ncbi:MAG: AMP-binding protein [Acidimicrobiales bacterium]